MMMMEWGPALCSLDPSEGRSVHWFWMEEEETMTSTQTQEKEMRRGGRHVEAADGAGSRQ